MRKEISNNEKLRQLRSNSVRPEREGQYWSDEEKKKLEREFYDGMGYSEMALRHHRSETAITNMIESLDLHHRKENPKRHKQPRKTSKFPKPSMCLSDACPYYREGYELPGKCRKCKEDE